MNRRVSTSFALSLYMSAALVFGLLHHHQHTDPAGHDDGCAACHWQLTSNTDAPTAPVMLPLFAVTWFQVITPVNFQAPGPFLPSTASRAPPVTSA